MPAQNAAVEPLPFEPVTTTEIRCSRARSTASASSNSAIRARQTPSPYFGRSNTQQSHRRKRVMPDFQDQVASAGFLQQPDRRVGIDLDNRVIACGSPPMSVNMSTAATRSPSASGGLPCQREHAPCGRRGFEHHRSARAQIHPPGNFPALALGRHGVERGIVIRHRSRRKAARSQEPSLCAASRSRMVRAPSPSTKGGYFRAA